MSARTIRLLGGLLLAAALLALLALLLYQNPVVQEQVDYRVSVLRADIKYALSPPEQAVFTPDPTLAAVVDATLSAFTPSPSPTETAGPTAAPSITSSPTLEPTPLPASTILAGIRHEYQKWNNCGPANLSMALSYWDWQGDQRPIAEFTKPNPRDKNVMPYELTAFIEQETDLRAVNRVGGTLTMLKQFISAGFPVIVEKGFEGAGFDGWMGHYEVVSGYDDETQQFTVQDSYIMADLPISYVDMEQYWRHFNYTFIVIFPPEREQDVMAILGPHADETTNFQLAAKKASDEIFQLTGRDQYFAWFNRGTNLASLQDYAGAANAYDEAYSIYAQLDPEERPWRILWYQTGPYRAYLYSGRSGDVISLATQTLANMSEPVLEESYYWRGLAREAAGDLQGAIADLNTALNYHPDWQPALSQLQRIQA
jgi:hypothetical protein